MGKLNNKVAIITGGISGIGAASAKLFAKEGAKLALVDYDGENGEKFLQEMKDEGYEDTIFIEADVANTEETDKVFDQVMDTFGRLDICFNNAGIGPTGKSHEYDYETFEKVVDIDLNAVFYYSQKAIQIFLDQGEGGNIVNTASMYGLVGAPTSAAYNAAKGGVINLTRSMGLEYAEENIRINALCPGYIDTPILDSTDKGILVEATPMGRLGTSEEIARGALFLASEDSGFMTGANLVMDGGYTAQ